MRRLTQLINNVRFQANEDSNRFSDARFIKIFNDAQEEVARAINVRASENSQFQDNYITSIVSGQNEYELPDDVYAGSYVTAVFRKLASGSIQYQSYEPLRRISVKEIGRSVGYFIQNRSIVLSLVPITNTPDGLMITYTKRIPSLSPRFGKITQINGQQITVGGYDTDTNPIDISDFICSVDKSGTQIDKGLEVDSYSLGKFTVTGTITSQVGDYVVIGENATTHSELPLECEKYLTIFAQRMVHYINSSRGDLDASDIFTEKEKSDISELFADNESDTKYPPIVDSTYLN